MVLLLGHTTVVALLVSADGAAADGILLGIEPGMVDNTAACTVLGFIDQLEFILFI